MTNRDDVLRGISILVIDDAPDNLSLAKAILRLHGAEVETELDVRLGITKALSNAFDLVLMDLTMPLMDGYEATRRLRELNYKGPVIALSAHSWRERQRDCLDKGFNGYVEKPFDHGAFVAVLKRVHDYEYAVS